MFAGLSREQCLQCSMSTLSPALGRTCGRREREAGAGSGRSNPFRPRARNGGRHPGPRGAGNLRGLTEERGSRPVRSSAFRGSFPCRRSHRRQQVSSGRRRRGTSSACAEAHALNVSGRSKGALHARGHVLHSVQRPVHVNRYLFHESTGQPGFTRKYRGRFGIAVGQTCASRRNRHRDRSERTHARLAARHRSAVKGRGRA